MNQKNKWAQGDWLRLGLLCLFFLIYTLFSLDQPFIWDNVLLSSQFAHWFYENGWTGLILGPEIDCGHPPFFGLYLAGVWKVFGKTLAVSHLAMLPFLGILAWHYFKISTHLFVYPQNTSNHLRDWSLLLLICEPTVMAQATMVSNDVVLIAGFLWAFSSILFKKRGWFCLATLMMTAVSVRGAILVFLLFVLEIIWQKVAVKKWALKSLVWYFPAALFFVLWNGYHWSQTGALLVGNNPEWTEHYGYVDLKGLIWNSAVVIKSLLDFGRIFLWFFLVLLLGMALYQKIFRKQSWSQLQKQLFWGLLMSLFLFSLVVVIRTNPIGHRYLAVFYLMSGWLLLAFLKKYSKNIQTFILSVVCLGLVSGNLWIYPDHIAQGWDASLAYVSWKSVRNEMNLHLQQLENKGQLGRVGAGFTMYKDSKYIDLEDFGPVLENKDKADLKEFDYVLYSNLVNNFTDDELGNLNQNWILEKAICKGGVCAKLFKNKP